MAKAARSHHCHAAFQLVVRLDRHRVARHHLAHRSLLRIEPGQQHFYGAVTLGHDTDQYVVVDDQHRPDPVVAHLAQGFDDHVAGTNMDQGATLAGESVFDCVHRVSSCGPCPSPPKWYAATLRRRYCLSVLATLKLASVLDLMSSRLTSGANSMSVIPPPWRSTVNTPRSVITMSTTLATAPRFICQPPGPSVMM